MAYFKFAIKLTNGEPIDVYNHGNLSRDFTYVDDIVDGIILSWTQPTEKYDVFNLGHDHPVKLLDFIKIIEKELGVTAKLNMLPMQVGDVHTTYADISKARTKLGYNPKVSIEAGLHEFVKWFKENKAWLLELEDPK